MQEAVGPFTLPNLLTIARIVMIPVIIVLMLLDDPVMRWSALYLFIVAGLTDYLDGMLARRQEAVSPLGRMLDPIADKLLVLALIVALAWDRTFSAVDLIPAIAIVLREVLVSGLREFLGAGSVTIRVSTVAKYKTTVQLIALGILIAEPLNAWLWAVSDALLWLAALLTLITGWDYWRKSWPYLSGDQT